MEHLLDRLMPELQGLLDTPFAFFGHSLGAWIAYGVAHRLRIAGGPKPVRLIVSSCRAPHLPPRLSLIGSLQDRALLEEVQRRYGLIPQVIMDDPVLMQMFLKVLHSDIALFESTRFHLDAPLACPVSAYGGVDDEAVRPEDLKAWTSHTSGDFEYRAFAGGHHYLRNAQGDMLPALTDSLTGVLTRALMY